MTLRIIPPYVLLIAILTGCVATGTNRIDNIPMYGQPELARSEFHKKGDEWFINKAVERIGSREKASEVWFAEGERYMRAGNLDYAMRRYNQSWLLNPNSYRPYWGFGQVMVQRDRLDEGIKYLEKAEAMIDDPYQKVALLSDLGSAYTYKGQKAPEFLVKASEKFAESTAMDPTYANAWRRWAFNLYDQGNYVGAWEKVKKAQSLNPDIFTPLFLSRLKQKAPEPR